MMIVVPAWPVPLSAEALNPEFVTPALEGPCTRLNAPDCLRARDYSYL